MSCALCSKWQHILCHNKRDQAVGHPTRNWDSVEFICQRCRAYQLDGSGAHSVLITKQPNDTPQSAALYIVPDTLQHLGSQGQEGSFRGFDDHRPNGMGQYSSAQGHFLSSTLSSASNVYDPPRQTVPFNHYQPTEHSTAQKAYRADSHPAYGNRQLGVIAAASYKPQVLPIIFKITLCLSLSYQTPIAGWNVATQTRNTEHSAAKNGYTEVENSGQYTYRLNESLRFHQLNDSSSSTSSTPRYPSQQNHSIGQFQYLPASLQPPLGR